MRLMYTVDTNCFTFCSALLHGSSTLLLFLLYPLCFIIILSIACLVLLFSPVRDRVTAYCSLCSGDFDVLFIYSNNTSYFYITLTSRQSHMFNSYLPWERRQSFSKIAKEQPFFVIEFNSNTSQEDLLA